MTKIHVKRKVFQKNPKELIIRERDPSDIRSHSRWVMSSPSHHIDFQHNDNTNHFKQKESHSFFFFIYCYSQLKCHPDPHLSVSAKISLSSGLNMGYRLENCLRKSYHFGNANSIYIVLYTNNVFINCLSRVVILKKPQ